MSEIQQNRQIFSLLEVTRSIQKTLAERYVSPFWVKAEMNRLNYYPQSGHCYPDLIEKKEGRIIAQIKSILWSDDYQRINDTFLKVLNEPLKNGINILISAKISFDPVYGLSLRILDIDPGFSLGELEREKQETIHKLKEEGIFHANKTLQMALLPKRIAIISVQTSKGYADFLQVIQSNSWGYKYFTMLFPALLQGENAVESIINQLKRIQKVKHHFDAVAIIRGGGGDVGLTCYNNYLLSKEIALFPIPLVTGIGHATNETVAEMIAYKNAITPTELADYLIQKFHNFSVPVKKAEEILVDKSRRLIKEEKLQLINSVKYFKSVTGSMLLKSNNLVQGEMRNLLNQANYVLRKERTSQFSTFSLFLKSLEVQFYRQNQQLMQVGLNFRKDVVSGLKQAGLRIMPIIIRLENGADQMLASHGQSVEHAKTALHNRAKHFLKSESGVLGNVEKNIELMNPGNVLKRGYSITSVNGKVLRKLTGVSAGDVLNTLISDGNIVSTINKINKNE